MYAGVPPVVLAPPGAALAVVHGETGLVAQDEAGYRRALEHLHAHPEERRRLGAAAALHARRAWSPNVIGPRWVEVYRTLMAGPKRTRSWPLEDPGTGAGRFVLSLGATAPQFTDSMAGEPTAALRADAVIAASPPVLCSGGGGILFYRDHYPEDGWLRLWTGLALHRQGRHAIAAGELAAAGERGVEEPRASRYLARALLGLRLRSEACTIAYMGASVTAQKDGYRPRLHQLLQRRFGRDHVMVNAGTGAIGSIGGLFLMDRLVLRHQPDLCFVEYATTDATGTTPPGLVGPALEEIVLRLRDAGCEPCLLLLPRAEGEQGHEAYREVAERHGVPLLDVAASLSPSDLTDWVLRDVVHTTPSGADAIARTIADSLDAALAPTGAALGAPGRIHDRSFGGATLVPASLEHLREPGGGSRGLFRLSLPYVEIGPDGVFEPTFDGELVGMVVVVGPQSGIVAIGDREVNLFDRWCHYERLSTVVFDPGLRPGSPLTMRITDLEVDRSVCPVPVADLGPEGKRLKVVGFMLRQCESSPSSAS
jgi:lysophospholipase L1-like esterase